MKEFKTTENLEEKIKVTSLEIIVTGSKEKPYFEIKYKELGKEDYDIGYSSYDLNNVFTWKDECFDIVNELEEEYNNGWTPCKREFPKEKEKVLACINPNVAKHEIIITERINSKDEYWHDGTILAWMPLPAPYTEGEAELYRAKSVDGEYQEYKGDWK